MSILASSKIVQGCPTIARTERNNCSGSRKWARILADLGHLLADSGNVRGKYAQVRPTLVDVGRPLARICQHAGPSRPVLLTSGQLQTEFGQLWPKHMARIDRNWLRWGRVSARKKRTQVVTPFNTHTKSSNIDGRHYVHCLPGDAPMRGFDVAPRDAWWFSSVIDARLQNCVNVGLAGMLG